MPIYEYQCKNCGENFEILFRCTCHGKIIICPKCNNINVEKLTSAPAIHFKGTGWTGKGNVRTDDPISEPGVKRVDNPTAAQKVLYKNKKKRGRK